MRAADIFKKSLGIYRKSINPPYRRKDLIAISSTVLLLIVVPLIVVLAISIGVQRVEIIPIQASDSKLVEVKRQTLELIKQGRNMKKSGNLSTLSQMKLSAKSRREKLSALIETNPEQVLESALSNKMRRFLPASVQSEVEKETSLEGSLEVFHSDNFDEGKGRFYYFLKKAGGKRVSLHFADGEPKVLSGSKVKVTGVLLGEKMAVVSSGGKDFKVLGEADVLAATAVKKVAVLLFNFQNAPGEPFNQDFARGVTFTNNNSANAYYKEISFANFSLEGKLSQDGDVFGWYTIPFNNTSCSISNVFNWADAAKAAASSAGVDLSGYNNFIYAFPRTSSCFWAGLAILSGSGSWINGSFNLRVVGHELGHNFGVHHSNSLICTDANGNRVPISTSCTSREYGDPFDIMGGSTKHMNNFQKGRVGWYEPTNTQTVTSNGTYTIVPIEKKLGGVQALRIPRDVNQNGNVIKYYYLEYRQPFGFDNFSAGNPVVNGVSIRLARNYNVIQQPDLIDTNASTGSFGDAALTVGQTFFDPIKNITIKTMSKDSNKATVEVSFGPQPCVRANPSIKVTPLSQWGDPGQTLSYQVKVTNNDSLACSSSTFLTTPTLPAGFSQNPTSFSGSLSPQNSVTRTINITSPSTTQDGFYTFSEKATNTQAPTFTSTASANYNVANTDITPPTVSITAPSNGATVSGTTVISVSATDNIGVNNVKFYVDNSLKSTDTISPYNFSWNTKTVSNGSHTLLAKAFDNAGNVGTSSTVTVNVSNVIGPPEPTKPFGVLKNDRGDYNFYVYNVPNKVEAKQLIGADYWNIPAGNNVVAATEVKVNGVRRVGVVKNEGGDYNFYLYSVPSGFQAASLVGRDNWNIPSGNNVVSIAGVDIDGDGTDEIAVMKNQGGDYNLYVYKAPSGTQATQLVGVDFWLIPSGNNTVAIAGLGDVDGDGKGEIGVVKNRGGDYNFYVYNPPVGKQAQSPIAADFWLIPKGNNIVDIDGVGDINGDGKKDLAVMKGGKDQNLFVYTVPTGTQAVNFFAADYWNIPAKNNTLFVVGNK